MGCIILKSVVVLEYYRIYKHKINIVLIFHKTLTLMLMMIVCALIILIV
jgi:hypothetical protein